MNSNPDERTVNIPPRGAYRPAPRRWSHDDQPGRYWPAAPSAGTGRLPGWPVTPTPPPWPARRRRGHRAPWIAAAGLILTIVIAVVVVFATRGDQVPPPPAPPAVPSEINSAAATSTESSMPPVPVAALSGLLLSIPDIAAIAGSATVTGNADNGDRVYEQMADGDIVEQGCVALLPAKRRAFEGSGYTASRQQFLTGQSPERQINQSVVPFQDATAAEHYVAAAKARWDTCANRSVNLRPSADADGATSFWTVGPVIDADGIISTTRTQDGGAGWLCHTGLAARNNVVINVHFCGRDLPESVVGTYVTQVAAKIEEVK